MDKLRKFVYASIMCARFTLLLFTFLVWGAALVVAAPVAHGRMTIREVPLNRTAAWEKHAAMLRENRAAKRIPPLRVAVPPGTGGFTARTGLPPGKVPPEWQDRISRASRRHGVAEGLLAAVLKAESDFNPHAVSLKGARGAMQIMPATGRALGLHDFFDPEANLDAGVGYLAALLREFSGPELALAAYNAGPSAVRRYGGVPPYKETRRFVARVLDLFNRYHNDLR